MPKTGVPEVSYPHKSVILKCAHAGGGGCRLLNL